MFKTIILSAIGFTLLASSAAAIAEQAVESNKESNKQANKQASQLQAQVATVEKTVANSRTAGLSPIETFEQITQAQAELMLSTLMVLLSQNPDDAELIVSTAMQQFPEHLSAIVEMAEASGVSSEIILTAAITAGIDPTLIAEPTAAGTAEPANLVSAPSSPGLEGGSGDGGGSVSPN